MSSTAPTTATEKKYFVNIEGTEYEWTSDRITPAQIRTLAGIPEGTALVQEDPEGNERTLVEGELIELKPGHRHGRAPRYRRGGR